MNFCIGNKIMAYIHGILCPTKSSYLGLKQGPGFALVENELQKWLNNKK